MNSLLRNFTTACIFFSVLIISDAIGQQVTGVSIIGARMWAQSGVSGPASSSDNQLVLFSGTSGGVVKGATGTGIVKIAAGVQSVVTGTATDCVLVNGSSGPCGSGGGTSYSAGDGIQISGSTISVDTTVPAVGLSGSQSLTFGSIAASSCSTQTITASGALIGDKISAGWPSGLPDGMSAHMRVTNSNEITVTLCKITTGSASVTGLTFGYHIERTR